MKAVGSAWDEKVDRAELLASQYEATAEILRFYVKVLRFQKDVQEQLNGPGADVAQLLPFVPKFLKILKQSGTPQMRELAASSAGLDWAGELHSYWNDRSPREYNPLAFVVTALLQPFARSLAARTQINRKSIEPHCPFCLSIPHLGVLRPEGEGEKRFLLCSLCGTEWEYRRVICPNCQELDKEKLPVYKSDQVRQIKLAACDTCHTYLKCIDLSVDGHAVPEIDDVASLAMSLWMTEQGFHPMQLNLFGF